MTMIRLMDLTQRNNKMRPEEERNIMAYLRARRKENEMLAILLKKTIRQSILEAMSIIGIGVAFAFLLVEFI